MPFQNRTIWHQDYFVQFEIQTRPVFRSPLKLCSYKRQLLNLQIISFQFKQALSMFSTGLQTGQLAPLIREFELGEEAVVAAGAGDMEAFVKALQKNAGEKKPKEDEGMDLD